MGLNIEIKARLGDPEGTRALAEALSSGQGERIDQVDTFFPAAAGRLKLRRLAPDRGELIHYHRPDRTGPKESRYRIHSTTDPEGLETALAEALGILGRVVKTRYLYMVGRTRIHLDQVEGLGHYLELEVVLAPGEDRAAGEKETARLMEALAVEPEDLVDRAYIDLLLE